MSLRNLVLLFLVGRVAIANGLIVAKSEAGYSFQDAFNIGINEKDRDKALSLGAQPKLAGPVNKLPSVKLSGILLMDGSSGVVAIYSSGQQPQYLLPQGGGKNAPTDPTQAWTTARIVYKKAQSDKAPKELPGSQFVAYLPGGVESLAALCMDSRALTFIAGKQGAFATQLELLAAAVKEYGPHPAMVAVETYVRDSMQASVDRFDNGLDSAKSLDQGLQVAKLSAQAYPAKPDQQKLRADLEQRRKWLDRRLAILRALAAGGEADTFLLAYRDFEKHQLSFPDLMQQSRSAFKDSLDRHWNAGKERIAAREYRGAYRELRLASFRQPSNSAVQKDLAVAWTEYSNQLAVDRRSQRKQLTLGQQEAITQSLHFASRYKDQGKLDDALKSVTEAEGIDPDNLQVLLKKAEVLSARNELGKALATLDKYDERSVDEERAAGRKLRNEIAFQLTTTLREQTRKIKEAWERNRFHETRRLAVQALAADDRDPDVLYYAGVSHLVTRDTPKGREFLNRYLENSNTMDADPKQRADVFRLAGSLKTAPAATSDGDGEPNWFSGKRLPAGLAYCPISLAFNTRIERVEASNKTTLRFQWDGAKLRSIQPAFEKPREAGAERPFAFVYEDKVPQVLAVEQGEAATPLSTRDPDDALAKASVLLINNPLIDPAAVEKLKGKRVTIGVAGNRYFHPFVWQRAHYFQLTYDAAGRVKTAHEIPGRETPAGSEIVLEFDWDGQRLMAVRGYPATSGEEGRRTPIYERRQQYQDGKLIGEEIKAGTRSSRIKYVYSGSTLASAHCDKDETIDERSREVFFAGAAARPRR